MSEQSPTRVDRYAEARAKVRSDTQTTAFRRLWDMAREALSTRASLGVATFTYTTDLVPGVGQTQIAAFPTHVEVTLSGIEWTPGVGDQHDRRADPMRYVLDEAWLLGVTVPSA